MKKLYISFLFLFLLGSFSSSAQSNLVKGVVFDTLTESKVPRAVITLVNKTDSIMVGFTRSNAAGEFSFKDVKAGKYILMIYHPVYAGYSDVIEVKEEALDLGNIPLVTPETLLKEVMIISSDAIKIKGDTIEYTADSFKVKENANVEDLLKKLPGIQVNRNGEITAQGKRVEKVLVDGEEFFSDDPTVATQNLKAESVDKIQVYEKKDEMSGETDQGTQTINITLKEDAKKGAFGKLKAGAGLDQDETLYYTNEAMINRFKPKQRASAYLLHSNTGKLNLDWRESREFGDNSNNNMFFGDEGMVFSYSSSEDDEFEGFGNYSGSGIPSSLNGGATFSRKWKEDKHDFAASYQYKQVSNQAKSKVDSENFLTDASFLREDTTTTNTDISRHALNFKYEVKLDSLSTLKWIARGSITQNSRDNFYSSFTNGRDGSKINSSDRTTFTDSDILNMNTSLNYTKKFKKADRKLNIFGEFKDKQTTGESFLESYNRIYGINDTLLDLDTTDQQKTIDKIEQSVTANVTYREPLSKKSLLEFRYYFNLNNQKAERFTFDKSNAGEYVERLDLLSSDYTYDFQSHRAGLLYEYKLEKVTLKFGSDVASQFYSQSEVLNGTSVNRDFLNVFPNASFVYSFSKMKQLRLNYNGYTKQPSITEIQPLRDNTDPFNIVLGNENLNPSFSNDVFLQYFDNQVMKSRYFYIWSNFSYVLNDIVTSNTIDSLRRNITQYLNKSGNMRGSLGSSYYMDLKKIEANANFGINLSYSKNYNYINDVLNITENQSYGTDLGFEKEIGEAVALGFDYSFYYNISGSSIQNSANINYWTQSIDPYVEVEFGKRLSFETNASYNLRQKTVVFNQNNNVLIWNATLDCKLFKGKNGILGLSLNDILNQNIGFQRNATAYSITQTRYNIIKRYFMLSFTWNFNTQKPKGVEDKQ